MMKRFPIYGLFNGIFFPDFNFNCFSARQKIFQKNCGSKIEIGGV